ncbi:MAG: bifunctional phosphopantothenoylcysteine decarboxylase/phosphopantothenate--cysteine ligase CoaBC [Bacteroidia bacterium]|nr:bifunctional phosphopantothenoylcysteine decarboxylase/phosphopantothenate--cysteine ligase CoaBC [Bacteroidia bacterium]
MAHILLGVTGGIAAYKAPELIRSLHKRGHEVTVILTQAAQRFVSPLVLEVLSRRPVLRELWRGGEEDSSPGEWTHHIALAHQADALLVAPATAHTIAKFALGQCDDLLSAVFLATRKPVLIAPAMESQMYRHPSVERNLHFLKRMEHVEIVAPGVGFLASGRRGIGRLASLTRLLAAVDRAISPPLFKGERVLITAGATREPWDAVRFISNGSSGQMALALAQAAHALGAEEVHVLAAHTEVRFPKALFRVTSTPTAQQMFEAFQKIYEQYHWLLFAAAVSDYTFAYPFSGKHKKGEKELHLTLVPTPDILAWAGQHRKPHQRVIGFALEEPDKENYAREKLSGKGADWIAFNPISPETGMRSRTNALTLLSRWGHRYEIPLGPKSEVARKMLIFIRNEDRSRPSA